MPEPRDPRRNPAVGDQLRARDSGRGSFFRVIAVVKLSGGDQRIEYTIPPMSSVYSMSLAEWLSTMSGAMEVFGRAS